MDIAREASKAVDHVGTLTGTLRPAPNLERYILATSARRACIALCKRVEGNGDLQGQLIRAQKKPSTSRSRVEGMLDNVNIGGSPHLESIDQRLGLRRYSRPARG
ncbi:hypothetical protein PILCRDRAFT_429932 [Piloderma croceum F 1598]|uniref:Uncharacterized protein n=1 Tax=Piloderma croceum (strain F 1598) TaxID=765440 RepID=A0A0C3FVT8_PILCF|nr:hypothetical protein PILCRDRAFT_429932 [Piloderma croceum F 1598]